MKTKPDIGKLPKWAQEYVRDIDHDRRVALAFTRTPAVERDIPIPTDWTAKPIPGWDFNEYLEVVGPACTTSSGHVWGSNERTNSRGGRALFSTRLLALKAMRHAMERTFAERATKVDTEIEREAAK